MLKIILISLVVIVGMLILLAALLFWHRYSKAPRPAFKEPAQRLRPSEWRDDEVTVGWIGHSTILMNVYGIKIITDPVFGQRVGQHLGIGQLQVGPKRHTGPAIDVKEIGHIDLVLLSHAHFDHFDIPSLKELAGPHTQVITAKRTSSLLRRLPFKHVMELGSDEEICLLDLDLKITAIPVKHWGNRYPWNINYGHTGYLIEKNDTRIFYPGDTAYTPHFRQLREMGEIDLAFMPIGAYKPDHFQWAHCTPEQAWDMFIDTGAKWLIPIHWDTFVLSYEPVEEPIERLFQAAGDEADRIVLTKHGEVFHFSKAYV